VKRTLEKSTNPKAKNKECEKRMTTASTAIPNIPPKNWEGPRGAYLRETDAIFHLEINQGTQTEVCM